MIGHYVEWKNNELKTIKTYWETWLVEQAREQCCLNLDNNYTSIFILTVWSRLTCTCMYGSMLIHDSIRIQYTRIMLLFLSTLPNSQECHVVVDSIFIQMITLQELIFFYVFSQWRISILFCYWLSAQISCGISNVDGIDTLKSVLIKLYWFVF